MGVEGRDKQKILEAGAQALSPQLGLTIQRLRGADRLFLSVRYRRDRSHVNRNRGREPAQAAMVCILKAAAME